MNKVMIASEMLKIAKSLIASMSSIVLETPGRQDKTVVEFSESGVKVLSRGGSGYLHFPSVEVVTRKTVRSDITIRKFDRGDRYKDEVRIGCSALVSSSEEMWDGHQIESSYGKRGDGRIGVSKSAPLPWHPNLKQKEAEYDKAVLLTLNDGRTRTIDWSHDVNVTEYESGSAPSAAPSEELRDVLIQFWDKHGSLPGLGGPVNAWAFRGMSTSDMEQKLRKKIYLNAGQKYWTVAPHGFSWQGNSPIDRAIYKSPNGGMLVLDREPSEQEKKKWSIEEFPTLALAQRRVDRDYEAGL